MFIILSAPANIHIFQKRPPSAPRRTGQNFPTSWKKSPTPDIKFFSSRKFSIFSLKIHICRLKICICNLKICICSLKIDFFSDLCKFFLGENEFYPGANGFYPKPIAKESRGKRAEVRAKKRTFAPKNRKDNGTICNYPEILRAGFGRIPHPDDP